MKKYAAKCLPVMLAAVLQVMPLVQKFLPLQAQGLTPSAWAIVFKLGVTGAALFGYHAISSASSPVIFTMPTTNFFGTSGIPANFKLTITNYQDGTGAYFTNATGFLLPTGMTITTYDHYPDVHGNIVGTPSQSVTNLRVKITANYSDLSVQTNINITIYAGSVTAPTITNQPQNLTALAGETATFTVTAGGTAPLSYQWRRNGAALGPGNSSLTFNNVRTNQEGDYTVVISNSVNTVTSSPAHLTVTVPPTPALTPLSNNGGVFMFSFNPVIGLTNTVLFQTNVTGPSWLLLTNIPPPASTNSVTVTDSVTSGSKFYRVSFEP